jgi:hypothetical protein
VAPKRGPRLAVANSHFESQPACADGVQRFSFGEVACQKASTRGTVSISFRIVVSLIVSFVFNTGMLMWSYPIWRELKYQRYPTEYWIEVYIGTGVLVTGLVWVVALAVHWVMSQYRKRQLVVMYIATLFVTLIVFAIAMGISHPYPAASWPRALQALGAKFFAEWNFFIFIFYNTVPIALISGLLFAFMLGRENAASASN